LIVSDLDIYHTQPAENSKKQPKANQSKPKQTKATKTQK